MRNLEDIVRFCDYMSQSKLCAGPSSVELCPLAARSYFFSTIPFLLHSAFMTSITLDFPSMWSCWKQHLIQLACALVYVLRVIFNLLIKMINWWLVNQILLMLHFSVFLVEVSYERSMWLLVVVSSICHIVAGLAFHCLQKFLCNFQHYPSSTWRT